MGKAFDDADNGLNVKITLPGYPGYSLLRTKGAIGPSIGDGGTIGGGGSVGGKIGDTAGTVIDQIAARNGVIRVGNGFRCPDDREFGGTFTDAMGTTCGIRLIESAIEGAIGEIEQTVFEALSERDDVTLRQPGSPAIYVPDIPEAHGHTAHLPNWSADPVYWDAKKRVETFGQTMRGDPISWDDPMIPDSVYHVTTAGSNIMGDGMIRAGGKGGLQGDDNDKIISLTTDREIAEGILRDMRLMHSVVNTEDADDAVDLLRMQAAELGVNLTEASWEDIRRTGRSAGNHEAAKFYFVHRDDPKRQNQGKKIPDPMFFGFNGDRAKKFARIDPEEFQLIEIPRENLNTGALVTNFDVGSGGGLSEVRIYGDITAGSVVEPKGTTAMRSPSRAPAPVRAAAPADLPKEPRLMVPSREHTPSPLRGGLADLAEEVGDWGKLKEEIDKRGVVFFDYETTGIDSVTGSGGAPVQIGAVKVKDGKVVERLNLYVKPTEPLSDWSKKNLKNADGEPLTEEWAAQQMDPAEAHRQLVEFFGSSFIAAHNAPFDFDNVLTKQLAEHQIEYAPSGILDTLELSRQVIPKGEDGVKSHSLGGLMEYFGDKPTGWHTAEADAEDTMKLFNGIFEDAIKRDASTDLLTKKRQAELERERALKVAVDKKNFNDVYRKYKNDREEYEQLRKDNPDLPPLSPEPPLPDWFALPQETYDINLPGTNRKIKVTRGSKTYVSHDPNDPKFKTPDGRNLSDVTGGTFRDVESFETDDLIIPTAGTLQEKLGEIAKLKPKDFQRYVGNIGSRPKRDRGVVSQEQIDRDIYIRSSGRAILAEATDRIDQSFFDSDIIDVPEFTPNEEQVEALDAQSALIDEWTTEISDVLGLPFVTSEVSDWEISIDKNGVPSQVIHFWNEETGLQVSLKINDHRSNPYTTADGRKFTKVQLVQVSFSRRDDFEGEFQFTTAEMQDMKARLRDRHFLPKRHEVNDRVTAIWEKLPNIAETGQARKDILALSLAEQRREKVLEVLRELGMKQLPKGTLKSRIEKLNVIEDGQKRELTPTGADKQLYESLERALERIEELYPSVMLERAEFLRIDIDMSRRRAQYQANLTKNAGLILMGDPKGGPGRWNSTFVHEFAHLIQDVSETDLSTSIEDSQYTFVKTRAYEDKVASLKKLFPTLDYDEDERVYEDNLSNAYMGKIYSPKFNGQLHNESMSEMLAVAMQYLDGGDTSHIAPGDMNTLYWAIGVLFDSFTR